MHAVELSQDAQKFLEKLDSIARERIETRLKRLANEPVPSDSKFVWRDQGDKVFRLRIGDYRALYKCKDDARTILVARIDKRPRVYG